MVHIESRKSKRRNSEVEIFVDCDCTKKEFNELIQLLKYETNIVTLNPPENIWTDEEGKTIVSFPHLSPPPPFYYEISPTV